jgi:hypothetical protein
MPRRYWVRHDPLRSNGEPDCLLERAGSAGFETTATTVRSPGFACLDFSFPRPSIDISVR